MTTPRHGFTRLDLLVASVLVVLSMGMLLPAAQEVKEAEKRKRCVNHLKQLGLAAANYDSTYLKLPPGWMGPLVNEKPPKYEDVQNLSILAFLLPYLEEDKVYRELQRHAPGDFFNLSAQRRAWFVDAELAKAGSARLSRFLCPSAPDMFKATDGVIVGVHFANAGGVDKSALVQPPMHVLPQKDAAFATLGRTNYFGVAGFHGRGTNTAFPGMRAGMARFEGAFTNRSQNSIAQLTSSDGTSNTLFFGEGTGGSHDWESEKPKEKAPMQFAASWMGCGALPAGGGMAQHGGPSLWYQFSSTHGDVVNFCFGDGAVKALRSAKTAAILYPKPVFPLAEPANHADGSVPYWIFQELAGMREAGLRPVESIIVKEKKP